MKKIIDLKIFDKRAWWVSILTSVGYGLLLRSTSIPRPDLVIIQVMSWSFLIIAPACLGYISIATLRKSQSDFVQAILYPWIPLILGILISVLISWEGWICVVMYLPLGLLMASIGGAVAYFYNKNKFKKNALGAIIVLPLVTHYLETFQPVEVQNKVVKTQVEIQASPGAIWNEIKSVRRISRSELPDSWVHTIGFPRPLDAEIDKEALGGVRMARFERDLVFIETVTDWKVEETLAFNIKADDIPPTTLDEHVTIGGPYFDVLRGRYTIEALGSERAILHLESEFRLSTTFNWYAGFWTNAVMQTIQGDILSVVKKRVEAENL